MCVPCDEWFNLENFSRKRLQRCIHIPAFTINLIVFILVYRHSQEAAIGGHCLVKDGQFSVSTEWDKLSEGYVDITAGLDGAISFSVGALICLLVISLVNLVIGPLLFIRYELNNERIMRKRGLVHVSSLIGLLVFIVPLICFFWLHF